MIKKYANKTYNLLENNNSERKTNYKNKLNNYIRNKVFFKNFSFADFSVYLSESCDSEGMLILLSYREDQSNPFLIFFKDGIFEDDEGY